MATKKQPTIQDLMNKIDEVYAEVLTLKQAKAEARASKVFVPKEGEFYWTYEYFVNDIIKYRWSASTNDLTLQQRGQIYPTKELAQAALDKQLATVRVLNKLRELEGDWVADWKTKREGGNAIAVYEHIYNMFAVYAYDTNQITSTEWYSTEEAWAWVIDNMADDLKLAWGIK